MTERGSGERQSAKSCKELHINPAAAEGVGFGYLRIQQSGNAELLRCVEGQAAVLPDGGGGEGVVHGGPVQQVGPVPVQDGAEEATVPPAGGEVVRRGQPVSSNRPTCPDLQRGNKIYN